MSWVHLILTLSYIKKKTLSYKPFSFYYLIFTLNVIAAAAKLLQSCPTLCDPIDGSPPGSPIPWILQARILEWVAISFSKAWKWKVKVKLLSRVQLLATPWTAAYQAPLSMGFSRQEYWSGLPLPSPRINLLKRSKPVVHMLEVIIAFQVQNIHWAALEVSKSMETISDFF